MGLQTKHRLLLGLGLTCLIMRAPGLPSQEQASENIVIGRYERLNSKTLGEERTLLIHLPRSYDQTGQSYPVLYMLYGNHVTTYFAEAVSILDNLGPTGRIPEMILVGITNTDRYRDLLPRTPEGEPTGIDDFLRFFESELIPYIDGSYRTKDYRLIIGPQAGANFVLYTLFERPDIFSAGLINSPFRWRGGRELLFEKAEAYFKVNPTFNKFLHITYDDSDALAEEGAHLIKSFVEMIEEADPAGFDLHLNFIEGNDEFLQPLGLREGLKSLFRNYPFPGDLEVESLADILSYYRTLSAKYGFDVDAPEHVLTVQSDTLMEQGRTPEAVAVLNFILEHYPKSANAYLRLGNLSFNAGRLEEARDLFAKMLDSLQHDTGMIERRIEQLDRMITGSAAYRIEREIRRVDLAAGLQKFLDLKGNPPPGLYFDEREFNAMGYRMLQSGRSLEAIEIFKLNVEMYPDSANVYDSLAEGYMTAGQNELAIKNYEKSLELDPDNDNARRMLEKLKKD